MSALAVEQRFATALLDPATPAPAGVVSRRGDADPLRFAVYRNNVHVGLTSALERAFPVVRRLVGDVFFAAMARAYVAEHKPDGPLLIFYGSTFADFIEDFAPARPLPYLADMARLEHQWLRAYHAAEAACTTARALAGISPHDLPEARLVPHPATRMVMSPFAIGSIWAAHQGETVARVAAEGAETVLLTRPHAEVRATVLPPADAPFVAALLKGATIMEAADAAPTADAGAALAGLVSLGAIEAIRTGEKGR